MTMGPTETDLEAHPEELLDRALRGRLATGEQQALDGHLAVCRACAAHLTVLRSARRVSTPEPWDDLLNRRAVERVLKTVRRGRWPGVLSVPFRRRWALAAAGVSIWLGGMAGATWWHIRRPQTETDQGSVVALAASPARAHRRSVPARLDPAPEAADEAPPSPGPTDPESRAATPRVARTQPSASSLFEEASALRDQNRPEQAVAVFRRLQRLYPRSRETRISFALAGRLLLDGGHPEQALAQFDQHLTYRGEASEEALAGRATALGQMGRGAAESETWRALLDEYPNTVYAPRAKRRLAELDRSDPRR
ncbi:MAG: tetratricopeptide repeat protein [Pseudomonadota bacterium]